MAGTTGTIVRGVRAPIIKQGDNIANITVEAVTECAREQGFSFHNKDVIAVTEAVVARAQGNYCSIDDIAEDIRRQFPQGELGVIFPIFSRNRFSVCWRGICRGAKKITLQLAYPCDEVGNHLVSLDDLDCKGINPYSDVLTESQFRAHFGSLSHEFTGVDYIEFYKSIAEEAGTEIEIILANDPRVILNYSKNILCCDIHSRERSKRLLKNAGAEIVLGLDNIMNTPVNGSGFNADYGLLGSNKATETTVKLFPRDCQSFADSVQAQMLEKTGKTVEVMVYGDGAFCDPVGHIWELADPVVSPGYTKGLEGRPNEVKLKYLADNQFSHLKGDELKAAIKEYITQKEGDLKGQMVSQGTTPRRIIDLLGSLCDLTSGSGDKGTPIVLVQGYFDNYSDQ